MGLDSRLVDLENTGFPATLRQLKPSINESSALPVVVRQFALSQWQTFPVAIGPSVEELSMMTVIEDMLCHHSVIVIIILFPAMLHYELLPSWHAQQLYIVSLNSSCS